MNSKNHREYSKKDYNRNGFKSQGEGQMAKSSFNTTIEEPALNKSGIDAKKKGF